MLISRIFSYINGRIKGTFNIAVSKGMKVGKNIRVMGNCDFGSEPYLIELGSNITISMDVTFVNHDGGTWAFRDKEGYRQVIKYGKIKVGDYSFIGCGSIILPGVKIGSRCVVGAGSVVTKDVPDGMIVAGNPARIISTTEAYAEKCKKSLHDLDYSKYEEDKKAYLLQWLD